MNKVHLIDNMEQEDYMKLMCGDCIEKMKEIPEMTLEEIERELGYKFKLK